MDKVVAPKTIEQLKQDYPLLEDIVSTAEVFWVNPKYNPNERNDILLSVTDIDKAEKRLMRFAPYIAKLFPETRNMRGIIESPLIAIPKMQRKLSNLFGQIQGSLYLKCDSHLPISGSIKARGGIYEVLKIAEDIAIKHNMLSIADNYEILDSKIFKDLFSRYSIIVGSTGNLGLSIGIMGTTLGFKVTVHMSKDAKQWKKDMLRSKGAIVVEHQSDYSKAVETGRAETQQNPNSYFIDDEKSQDLFLGYAVAARRLKKQLDDMKIIVDQDHPLFVYLPCGVGGGPGGVTFGLKTVFKDCVHCFFAEPTHSPAMLIGLMTGLHNKISVQDFKIDNITEADGLAVGRPSGFVGKLLEHDISGVFTIQDINLYLLLRTLADTENIFLEPSALAGFWGPLKLPIEPLGHDYLIRHRLEGKVNHATHIVWATGGSMVPPEVMHGFYNKSLNS